MKTFSYLPRTLEKVFKEANSQFKVLMVSGMRQVGKSTLLGNIADNDRKQVSLDDMQEREDARNQPAVFFRNHRLPLYIDEIQRVPELFLQLKAVVDAQASAGAVWLTGSQRFALMKGVGDSLAGRIIDFELMPFSIYEREGKGLLQEPYMPSDKLKSHLPSRDREETLRILWQGAWPQAVQSRTPSAWARFYRSIVQNYLERDIRTDMNIGKIAAFHRFITALALRTGQELRIGVLAQMAGVNEATVKRWLSIAEASGVIYLLPPFFVNVNKQLVKSPKVYFTDTGLACWLCNLHTPEEVLSYKDAGALFETFVITEILKSWRHNGLQPQFYFYRDSKGQAEIDLLVHHRGIYHPVEIKLSEFPDKSMVRHFDVLKKLPVNTGTGALICCGGKSRWLTENVITHAIWQI